jgi:hypothetical protein
VFAKFSRALFNTTLQLDDLVQIPAPTLVMAADDDLVSLAHLEAMRDAFPRRNWPSCRAPRTVFRSKSPRLWRN